MKLTGCLIATDSCDAGYYCTHDSSAQTWCCPEGQTLAQCAALYSITGSLVSETVAPTTTSTSSMPMTTASYGGNMSVTTDVMTDYTTVCPSASATISYPGNNSTVKATLPTVATVPTISTVPIAAAGLTLPSVASVFVVAAAALAATLL
jgi:hypothetical protein